MALLYTILSTFYVHFFSFKSFMHLKQFEFSRGFDLMKIKTKLQTVSESAVSLHQPVEKATGEMEKKVTWTTEITIREKLQTRLWWQEAEAVPCSARYVEAGGSMDLKLFEAF